MSDDVGVTAVAVQLKDAGGAELESGAAVLVADAWRYVATRATAPGTTIMVTATATDAAGNAGAQTLGLVVSPQSSG